MAELWLLDTGVLVALVNAADPDHDRCVEAWRSTRGPVATVEGTLVEAAHLLRRARGGPAAAIGLVLASGVEIVPATPERLARAVALMDRYRNVPMDLVDAMLVALAEERCAAGILSLDRRGFSTFRVHGRRALARRPG